MVVVSRCLFASVGHAFYYDCTSEAHGYEKGVSPLGSFFFVTLFNPVSACSSLASLERVARLYKHRKIRLVCCWTQMLRMCCLNESVHVGVGDRSEGRVHKQPLA